ncbi:MAG: BTAD domain-containing putative transcriptional regulator [Sneathiella sp.]
MGTHLNIRIFGGFHMENSDGNPVKVTHRKANALIGYLALQDGAAQTRERLAGLLWSEYAEEQARASLRQTVRRLRTFFARLEVEPLEFGRQEIVLHRDKVVIDAHSVLQDLHNGIVPSLLVDIRNPVDTLLYGMDDLDGLFTSWLRVTRQSWADKITSLLTEILRKGTEENSKAARALLNIDRTHEEAHRLLIRFYADAGNITAALDQYKSLWDILDADYDMEPSEETQKLITDIKLGTYAPPSPPAIQSLRNSIDALPVITIQSFESNNLDDSAMLRANGLRYELIASLVKFRQWIILEGDGNHHDLEGSSPPFSKEVSHNYGLKGAFFVEHKDIRLILTLSDLSVSRYIWSTVFTLHISDWSELQRLIVRQISVALNIHMTQQQLTLKVGNKTLPADTYDMWLKGQALSFVWQAEEREQASEIFSTIMQNNPGFTPAYCSLVQLKNTRHIAFPGVNRDHQREEHALEIARLAVEHDPLDSQCQLCLAWSFIMNGFADQAINHFWLALDLNENDPWTMISSAGGLAIAGEREASAKLAKQSLDLNPVPSSSHWSYQATVRFLAEDYKGCIAAVQQARDAIYYLPAWEAAAHIHLGNRDRARERARDFFNIVERNWYGSNAPTHSDIAAWLEDCVPVFKAADRKCLQDGFFQAGIPVSG